MSDVLVRPQDVSRGGEARGARRLDDPAVLVAIAAVLVGALWLGLIMRPTLPGDDSADAGFARDMIVHHAQAVEMAEIVRARTRDPAIRILATDIVLTQQAQIGQMRGWLDAWGLPQAALGPRMAWTGNPVQGQMPGMAAGGQVAALARVSPKLADIRLLRLMIPHHQAAIAMSKAALELTERPEVRALAQGIVRAQKSEIAYMQKLLRQRGAPPVTGEINFRGHGPTSGHEEEGFASSVSPTLLATGLAGPLVVATFALGWLVFDGAKRRHGGLVRERTQPPTWTYLAVGGLMASALLHAGLVPAHFDERAAYGWFFVVATALASLSAALIVAWPSRPAYLAGATLSLVLILLYLVFRVVPPPGSGEPEGFDLIGLVTKAAELVAAAACLKLWSFARSERAPLSETYPAAS